MKALKMMIVFIVILSGCSPKHILRTERKLLDREILESWDELKGEIVKRDSLGFSLGFQVKAFNVVRRNLRIKEFYEYGSGDPEEKSIQVLGGLVLGCSGCFLGYKYGLARDEDYIPSLLFPNPSDEGCKTACLWALPGCILLADGLVKGREYSKAMPDFVKIDTVCMDSMFLVKQKIKVEVEKSDFEKICYTDEYGNIELKFNEILSDPKVADSVLNVIIRYYEMVDTVDVKIK